MVLAGLASLACAEAGEPRDAAYFLARLHDVSDLPRLERVESELAAGWDPSGANAADGYTYLWVDGVRNVLLDVDGPGCIHRISTGELAAVEHTQIEIYLDHELLLAMPAGEFFDMAEGPFASGFAGGLVRAGPYPQFRYPTVRMPIPFATHAQVRLISPTQEWGSFWQIGYTRYPSADVQVESLQFPLDPRTQQALDEAAAAWDAAVFGLVRPQSPDITLADTLAPGEALAWDERGCGTIERMRIEIPDDWPGAWRSLRLRASWDDAAQPAIELPVAEFLGAGDYVDDPLAWYDSLLMGADDDLGWIRLPMPYRTAARIELINTGTAPLPVVLDLWRRRCASQDDEFGYLHASVVTAAAASEDSPRSGPLQIPVHRLFDREGRGKVVGTMLRVEWPYADLWWGEGDWQIWMDQDVDEWPPRYHGTGTEEFFDGGWTRFERKALSGVIKPRPGLVTVYGFMLNDALQWQQHIRMQVETLGLGAIAQNVIVKQHPTFSSTVYWYDEAP
jgi:hypothetical protein